MYEEINVWSVGDKNAITLKSRVVTDVLLLVIFLFLFIIMDIKSDVES